MTGPAASRLFDNPSVGRLLRSHLRPRRLIVMSTLHAAILLLAVCVANVLNAWADFRTEIDAGRIGFVRLLFGVLVGTECLLVTLYVPIRCGMILYEDRREGGLGELAALGLSPLRLCWGQVCVVMAGMVLQLLCALPFLSLCVVLGDVPVSQVAAALTMLLCYALAVGSMAVAVGLKQSALPFLLVLVLLGIGGAAIVPDNEGMPSAPASLSPVRGALDLVVDGLPKGRRWRFERPQLWSVAVPCWALSCAYSFLVAGIAWAYILAGPGARFEPGLNDFDSVTLAYGKSRRAQRWYGAVLKHKVQLAFLYENRPAWLKRASSSLREAAFMAAGTLALTLTAFICTQRILGAPLVTWQQGWRELFAGGPKTSVAWYVDGGLVSYGFAVAVWAGIVLPYARRNARERVLSDLGSESSRPLAGLELWHLLGIAVPMAVLVLVLSSIGKSVTAITRIHVGGFWLLASTYSLTVGSAVAAVCMPVRHPVRRSGAALAVIACCAVVPSLWRPLFLLDLLPVEACYLWVASFPMASIYTVDPWHPIHLRSFDGADFICPKDWRIPFLIHVLAAVAARWWYGRAVRRLRERASAQDSSRA